MCDVAVPSGMVGALATLDSALACLSSLEAGTVPASVLADVLRGLERAESRLTAARSRALTGFASQAGPEGEGQGSARAWLKWQTRVTGGAAADVVGWARRLAAHPVVADALARGDVSRSWARQICAWSDLLPDGFRDDADQILLDAASGGAALADLAVLADEMRQRSGDSAADDGGFGDRYFRLGVTFGGAGRAEGDLTPECAAALSAVLDALGKKVGPQDARTAGQRRHDALAEACRRLVAAGLLPGRAGQPTQVQVHISLAELRAQPGAAQAEAAWLDAAADRIGWLTGPAAQAAACDASMVPLVAGHVDWAALDQLCELFLAAHGVDRAPAPNAVTAPDPAGPAYVPAASAAAASADPAGPADLDGSSRGGTPRLAALSPQTRQRLRQAMLALAVRALSGPGGLAAALRATCDQPALTTVSLPLDIGAAAETIPAHLRRAAAARHPHCAFPGCEAPASVCDIHHLTPRAEGGPTALANLVPLCRFHHLIVIHKWGWALRLNPDGTTTATSPDGRSYGSHDPPSSHDPPLQRRARESRRRVRWPL